MKFNDAKAYAHRGLHNKDDSIVENSKSALLKAIEAGFGIEIDIQMSSERQPIVFHDETLSRLTGRDGRLSFMKTAELVEVPYATGTDKIIDLNQCLTLINGKVPLLIEVKSHWTGLDEMEPAISTIINKYQGPVGVMSFDPRVIRRLKELNCKCPLGLVTSHCPAKDWPGLNEEQRHLGNIQFKTAHDLQVDFIAHDIANINNDLLSALIAELNIPLFSWTVRTNAMLKQAQNANAKPIFEHSRTMKQLDLL